MELLLCVNHTIAPLQIILLCHSAFCQFCRLNGIEAWAMMLILPPPHGQGLCCCCNKKKSLFCVVPIPFLPLEMVGKSKVEKTADIVCLNSLTRVAKLVHFSPLPHSFLRQCLRVPSQPMVSRPTLTTFNMIAATVHSLLASVMFCRTSSHPSASCDSTLHPCCNFVSMPNDQLEMLDEKM